MIILATNKDKTTNIVIENADLFAGNRKFMLMTQSGSCYDPENNFHGLYGISKSKQIAEYKALTDAAEMEYFKLREKFAPSSEPKPSIGDKLEEMLLKTITHESVDTIVKGIKPQLDEYIMQTYGMLPITHEIVTPAATTQIKGVVHEKFDEVLKLVAADIPVFLTGAAGTGKNVICKQIAEALGKEFYFSNAVTQEYKLTGFIDANGTFHETQFYEAFTQGGVFMLDEIDASIPEVLVILNAAIANRYFDFPTGRVEAHPDFRLVAAGNTFGTGADIEYTGRYQLDAASLDRFALVEIDYSTTIELALAQGDKDLVTYIEAFRAAVRESGIKHVCSYRSLERIKKLDGVLPLEEVLRVCLFKSLSKDDAKILHEKLAKSLGRSNKYFAAEVSLVA